MSNQQQHAPEPWRFGYATSDGTDAQAGCWLVIGADSTDTPISIVTPAASENDLDRANARRIVACVNACAGIPTDLLEAVGMPAAAGALRPAPGTLADVQELLPVGVKVREAGPNVIELYGEHLQQRDQLLAALKIAQNCLHYNTPHEDQEIIRAAIAAAGGA